MNTKNKPPYYGIGKDEQGREVNYGELIKEGKCQFIGEYDHWNYLKNKTYDYYYVSKGGGIYGYTIIGEETGITITPDHFFQMFIPNTPTK